MRFRRGARLDPGQVTDVRGRRMGPGGLAVGGGGLGLAALVVYLLIAVLGGGGGLGELAPLEDQQVGRGDTPGEVSQECVTGEDANRRQDCRIVAVVNSVQRFWEGVFQRSGRRYPYADTVFFTDQVQTQCGFASSQVGPFYCPRDEQIYIDLGFFDELQSRFGAGSAPFAQAYVIAHEVGHHMQNQLSIMEQVHTAQQQASSQVDANRLSVMLELQADCFSGVWAHNADRSREILEQGDIEEGLNAASSIGDDRLQMESQGQMTPDSFTHGSSVQRVSWFERGLESGDISSCNTFEAMNP
jgi:predicted metalloprotease